MRQYVLVAGVDYERKGVDFRVFVDSRVARLVAANKAKEDLRFEIFDVRAGKIITRDVGYAGGRRVEKQTVSASFTPVTTAHYDSRGSGANVHYTFKDGQTGTMSVTDVYSSVRTIGASAAGTLHELSFFSHAWHGGPILVNSSDDGSYTVRLGPLGPPVQMFSGAARDPDDKDPRSLDFTVPRMTAAQLTNFRDAFHADGYSWSWGCAFYRDCHEILTKLERHKDYRSSGMQDAKVLTFTNFRAEHLASLTMFLGATFPTPHSVDITFGDLKLYFCLVTTSSFTHHLAVGSNRHVFGGLMGTYSEYDAPPRPLMHIHKGFGSHVKFYRNYLGFDLDPEGRLYGKFLPGFVC